MNFIMLKGHVGQEPTIRSTESGNKVMQFSLATTDKYKDKDGSWKEEPAVWHNIVAWGYLTDNPVQKGNLVQVIGKITNRKYTDKDGVMRYITEVVAKDLDIIKVMKKVSDVPPPSGLDDPKFRYNQNDGKDAQGFTQPSAQSTPVDAAFFQSDIAPAPTNEPVPF